MFPYRPQSPQRFLNRQSRTESSLGPAVLQRRETPLHHPLPPRCFEELESLQTQPPNTKHIDDISDTVKLLISTQQILNSEFKSIHWDLFYLVVCSSGIYKFDLFFGNRSLLSLCLLSEFWQQGLKVKQHSDKWEKRTTVQSSITRRRLISAHKMESVAVSVKL